MTVLPACHGSTFESVVFTPPFRSCVPPAIITSLCSNRDKAHCRGRDRRPLRVCEDSVGREHRNTTPLSFKIALKNNLYRSRDLAVRSNLPPSPATTMSVLRTSFIASRTPVYRSVATRSFTSCRALAVGKESALRTFCVIHSATAMHIS